MAHRSAALAHRVLVVAPYGRDAEHLSQLLSRDRYDVVVFQNVAELARAIDEHSGVLLLSEEALVSGAPALAQALGSLPPWTDMPCVLLRARLSAPHTRRNEVRLPTQIINRVVLERPTTAVAILDAVAALMRARQKQFEIHQHVMALSESRRQLEERVIERTARLQQEMESRLRADEALRQSQKTELLGQLTGGVAHDFNNLLTPIVGALDLLREGVRDNPRFDGIAATGLQAAERARVLVQRLLAFARRQHLHSQAVDLGHLFEGLTELWQRTLGPTIVLRFQIDAHLPSVEVDQNQLELALLNLAVNARDAMKGSGNLTVSAVRRRVHKHARLRPGDYVQISVADEGCGMDDATLQKAVEPFFTTKDVGAGTGLGLSMVHGLAAQSGGELIIESAQGKGTTVRLLLPVAPQTGDQRVAEPTPTFLTKPIARKVLLVDDEELLRSITSELLSVANYQVSQAESGRQALELLEAGLRPDIVVTDYAMQGMTGIELARVIGERLPGLPVLMTTGYAALDDALAYEVPRLAKPFRSAELIEAIERVIREAARDQTTNQKSFAKAQQSEHGGPEGAPVAG